MGFIHFVRCGMALLSIHLCMISKSFPKLQNNLCSVEAKLSIFHHEVSYPFLVSPWIELLLLMNIFYHPHFN